MSGPPSDPSRRFLVAFLSMSAGVIVAAIDMAIAVSFRAKNLPAPNGKVHELDGDIGLQCCLTLFGVGYFVGKLLYRWMGAHKDLAELKFWSSGHMLVLNGAMGAILLYLAAMEFWQTGVLRPALFVALFMLGSSLRSGVDFLKHRWLARGVETQSLRQDA